SRGRSEPNQEISPANGVAPIGASVAATTTPACLKGHAMPNAAGKAATGRHRPTAATTRGGHDACRDRRVTTNIGRPFTSSKIRPQEDQGHVRRVGRV